MAQNNIDKKQLKEIMRLQFGVTETVLYLNTHPFDETVLQLHNEYASRLRNTMQEYQRRYGPLENSFPGAESPWRWIQEPWPWQINY